MPEALQQASSHQEHPAEGLPFDSASLEDVGQSNPTTTTASDDTKPPHPIEKTISCVSCRRRKLKCDRVKPACGTCSRLRHECEYPERRRNLGAKRRNMKELEARLAQVETKLVTEANSLSNHPSTDIATIREQTKQKIDSKWKESIDVAEDYRADIYDGTRGRGQSEFDFDGSPSTALSEPFSNEVISLGFQEPLPTDEAQDELHRIFFDNIHISIPLMHKRRYFTKLKLGPNLRPPVCLQYIMWASAASVSDKYGHLEDVFYTRARRYAEAEEMKGYGEAFITVYHAQTWILISAYEAKKTLFTRAWMSTGKATRLVHMMGLYRLDGAALEVKQILPPAKDWIELEERRRTFWGAYYGDRWSSAGTGWPMIINESEILTNLPCSDEDFENGRETHSISLIEAMTGDGASKISSYAGVVLSATLFGHNFAHIHRRGPYEQPENQLRGEFWERHRRMDNTLTNTFMFLPQHLRLPQGLRDINVVFLNMNIHTAVICLHKAAIMTAEKHHLDANFIRQSRSRCSMAAEEITNIMRLVSHVDAANMNAWMVFCLYVAGGVFIEDQRTHSNPQSASNLEFLVIAMKAIGKRHPITNHFIAQLIFDMEAAGIASRENIVLSKTGPVPSWKETNLMGSITESPNSECSPAVIEEPDHTKPSGQGCFTTCGINSPFPMSGMVQQDDQKATSQSPHASTPADQLDNHSGTTKDNTSRFFILSQEPRTKASSTSTTLHSSSNSLSGGVPQDGIEDSPRDIDIRDSKARDRSKSVDPEHRIDMTPTGIQINSGFDRVPWITPNQQPGSTQSAAAYAAFRPGVVVPFGLQETDTRQNRNASRFIASPNQNRPVPQAQNLVSAPSPNVNLTQFTIREATKQPDYEMWNTQDMDTYSMQNGWNIDMNDVAMQDGFQMGTFDNSLREGDGVTDFLNGIGLSDWNRGGS